MTSQDVKRNIWRNTFSNYVCIAVRLVTGVIVFRLLFQSLSREEFGFWAVLWSVFGYGILLDFGFGFTAQKRVAELSVHQNWEHLSRVLSTILCSYAAIAILMILFGVLAAGPILALFPVSPENRTSFEEVLRYFLCGLGVAFPLGLFPEILRGQQRISLANYIFCVGMIVNFALTALALHQGWGLKALLLIALWCTFVPDLACGFFAMRKMPEVRLSPRYFSKAIIGQTMSFSIYAYLITLGGIVLTKTNQLIIGSTLALSAVAIYQAGAKIAEMFTGISHQLPDTFSPAAAHLHAKGDRPVLQKLLADGIRFSVMLATPLYVICVFNMNALLALLTGDRDPKPESYWAAQVLLLWGYILVVTQSVPKRVFMMCGHEKRLTRLTVGEAALNLALSIGLILYFRNVLSVALGSLIASSIFGWFFLWPWAAREAGLSSLALVRTVLLPTVLACAPLLALFCLNTWNPDAPLTHNLLMFVLINLIACVVAAVGLWRIAIGRLERQRLTQFVQFKFGKLRRSYERSARHHHSQIIQ